MPRLEFWVIFVFLIFIAAGVHDISKDVKALREKMEKVKRAQGTDQGADDF